MERRTSLIRVYTPPAVSAAVKAAAAQQAVSASDYAQRAILAQLRADGLDPVAVPGLTALYRILGAAGTSVAPGGA